MGIFKGDSIYKAGGGGGGGYKDGGQLIDGDFIKVENNTVSSYYNVSRDPINLYLEPNSGEILNAIVELTTDLNATVNVYTLKNGFFVPIGNSGYSATAGNEYKINIIGDSFEIDQITRQGNFPEAALIGSNIYPVLNNNGLLWICRDLKESVFSYKINSGRYYYEANLNFNINGWRLPNNSEFQDLVGIYGMTALKSNSGWGGYPGNNSSGMGLNAYGEYNLNSNNVELDNWAMFYMIKNNDSITAVRTQANDPVSYNVGISGYSVPVRLVKAYP